MGYHGNILLKTNVGVGEAEIEGLIYWEGGATDNPNHYVLLQRNWRVKTMGSGITRLCGGDVSWLLQNWGD